MEKLSNPGAENQTPVWKKFIQSLKNILELNSPEYYVSKFVEDVINEESDILYGLEKDDLKEEKYIILTNIKNILQWSTSYYISSKSTYKDYKNMYYKAYESKNNIKFTQKMIFDIDKELENLNLDWNKIEGITSNILTYMSQNK